MQIELEVLKASHLPRKKPRRPISPSSSPSFRWHRLWKYRKYHACHANRAWFAERVTPATQKAAGPNQSYSSSPSFRWRLWRFQKKAPRLPRKSGLRCWKGCHACHAKSCGAQSVLVRRQASADIYYRDTESTTPRGHACRAKSYGAESVLVRRQGSKPLAWHLGVSNVFGCFKLAWPLAQIPPTHPLKSWGGRTDH